MGTADSSTSSYPTLSSTGTSDNTPSDAATDYDAGNDDGPSPTDDPDCVDEFGGDCAYYKRQGYCRYDWFVEEYCMKTCDGANREIVLAALSGAQMESADTNTCVRRRKHFLS